MRPQCHHVPHRFPKRRCCGAVLPAPYFDGSLEDSPVAVPPPSKRTGELNAKIRLDGGRPPASSRSRVAPNAKPSDVAFECNVAQLYTRLGDGDVGKSPRRRGQCSVHDMHFVRRRHAITTFANHLIVVCVAYALREDICCAPTDV